MRLLLDTRSLVLPETIKRLVVNILFALVETAFSLFIHESLHSLTSFGFRRLIKSAIVDTSWLNYRVEVDFFNLVLECNRNLQTVGSKRKTDQINRIYKVLQVRKNKTICQRMLDVENAILKYFNNCRRKSHDITGCSNSEEKHSKGRKRQIIQK